MAETVESPMLEIDRVLPASAHDVFAAFTDPDQVRRWWGPKGFSIPSLRFEPRVGDTYRIEMQPPEGDSFHLSGEFREVNPPSRLAITFVWEPANPDDVQTLATISLSEAGESTGVSLSQGPFKTDERRALHHDGWTESFDKLEAMLSSRS